MADLTPPKHLSIAKMHLDIAYLEFVKVHLNTLLIKLRNDLKSRENFYDLFCDIFMIPLAKEICEFEVNTRRLLLLG